MEPAIPAAYRRYTEQEYLRLEAAAERKHEFRHGRVVAMAGGLFDHDLTVANLIRQLGNRLDGKGCLAVGSDTRVRIPVTRHYSYPDVSVVCGSPLFDPPDRRVVLLNPQVIFEVLSASTEVVDRGEKFRDYIGIESLQEYVLVAQDRPLVETFYRQPEGIWAVGPCFAGTDASVRFRSLGVAVPLADVYAGVQFPPHPAPSDAG